MTSKGGSGERSGEAGKPRSRGPRWRPQDRERVRRAPGRGRPDLPDDRAILYGWHPVVEALRNPRRRPLRLVLSDNAARRLAEALGALPIEPEIVSPDAVSRLVEPDAVHQGLYLETEHLPSPALASLPADALLLALDQVTDPHNVGAIVRTAAAFGVAAIITTVRHSPGATGVLAKAASGGLEHAPFLTVRNLAETLIELGERGFHRVGLDSEGGVTLAAVAPRRPVVLVLGAEGKGLRQRTREICDEVARLDLPGAIASVNVSNAAAIALYALTSAPGFSAPR